MCCLIVAAYGVWLWGTHFYYKRTAYILGVKNSSDAVIRNVKLRLEPSGNSESGILDPNQGAYDMDPPWPVPQRIIVTFNEDAGAMHEISLTTGLPEKFRGKLIVLITKTNNVFGTKLETGELDH